jgi:hypothetical protein
MSRRNATKLEILRLVEKWGPASVDEIVLQSGGRFNSANVRMELCRLYRQHLLSRFKKSRAYYYEITDRGDYKITFYENAGL